MGGPSASPWCWVGIWACVVLLCSSFSTEARDLNQPEPGASVHMPLPLLLDSLRHDILKLPGHAGHASRTARHAAPDDADVPWYSAATRGGDVTLAQEELNVTSVFKHDQFNFGAGVNKWHSISAGTTTYLVGLGSKHFTLLTATFVAPDVGAGQTYSMAEEIFPLPSNPLAATVFKHWNAANKTMDVILVLSTENEGSLMWYRINSGHVEPIRSWPVPKRVSHLRVFKIKEQMKLLTLTSCTLELVQCGASADVFDFDLGSSLEARLSWSISLETAAVSGEVGAVGDEVYLVLALPDANVAKLYRYHLPLHPNPSEIGNHTTYGSFEFWKDLPSPQVSHATFFHVSYKMYLAVGGAKPALFHFVSPTRIEGCPKALQGLGFVSSWLILPIQTYRDEVVVLAEVSHSSGTGYSRSVVTLTWSSANVFNWQEYSCFVGGKSSPLAGASCLLESSEWGLAGAVALQLGDASVVSVLVPKGALHSALFAFQTHLQPNMNPLLSEIRILKEAQAKLTHDLDRQVQEMQATERLLLDTLNPSGHNVIKADWVIQEVKAQYLDENTLSSSSEWPPKHSEDISNLRGLMKELDELTKSLVNSLSDAAVLVNGEVHLSGHQTLFGGLEVQNRSSFGSLHVSQLNGESVPTLLKHVVRIDQLEREPIGGIKTLSDLQVSDVIFNTVNEVQKEDLIFNVPDKIARVNGVLEVTEILNVQSDIVLPPQGTVGGVDLSEVVFIPGKSFTGLVQFDEVTVEGDLTVNVMNKITMNSHNLKSIVNGSQNMKTFDSLDVGGKLIVERINGFLWSDIVSRIVWRDQPDQIPETTSITGMLTANSMKIEKLNGLNFPHDFVLKSINSQQITATKKFSTLLASTVDSAKTIDGISVSDLVTLRTDQTLNGELKLEEADISGDIKVDKAVNRIVLNRQKSPPLGPNVMVSSNVQFTNLTVAGTVQIVNTLNNQIFKDVVQDILVPSLTSNETVFLDGRKTLRGALKVDNIKVSSGVVNDKKIDDIARIDSRQIFLGDKTIDSVVFQNLQVTGLWDGVNVVELNAEAVRLTGVQDTKSHLTFTDSSNLLASQLFISEKLNSFVPNSILPTSDTMCVPLSTNSTTCLIKGSVLTDVMKVSGNVVVNGQICGWKLDDFDNRRMSRSRVQTITGSYSFDDVSVNHITVHNINGIAVSSLGRNTAPPPPPPMYDDLAKLLIDGGFEIDELVIEGHIQTTSGVNSLNLNEIAQKAVKLDASNTISGSLAFEDVLKVSALDVTGYINDYDFAFAINDAVLKSLEPVTFKGRKIFNTGFIVEGNIKTSSLNGLVPSTIVTRTTPATFSGTLKVVGGVWAGNVNLIGLLNNIPVTNYQNRYKLLSPDHHELKGKAHFEKGVLVDDLSVLQSVKKMNLEEFFKSVVLKNDDARISALKVFVNKVAFKNVDVRGRVNNLTLGEMAQDLVLTNDDVPITVHGQVRFDDTLTVSKGVTVFKNLRATQLDSCLVKEWLDNAIYLSQPTHISGVKDFSSVSSNSDLKLTVLNAVDLSKVITLGTAQDISADLSIIAAVVRNDLNVGGTVNRKKLLSEYKNTLMTKGNQVVTGPKTFLKGFTAKTNILTRGLISERNISNSVTLKDEETVTGPLKFSNIKIDQDLRVTGLISNLDVQKWNERALLKAAPIPQVVTGSYDVKGKITCLGSIEGRGLLGGESVPKLQQMVYNKRDLTRKTQDEIMAEWTQLCHDTDALLEKARAQPFLFRQLEVVQSIVSSQFVASMHAFEALNEQFLAVSYSNNCSGAMYRWNRVNTAWELINGAVENIGSVEKWATLRNAGSTYLITSDVKQNCPYQGGNIWQFDGADLNPRNVQSMDAWRDAQIDETNGHIHLLRESGVERWSLVDGVASKVQSWPLPKAGLPAHSQFVPRSAGFGLSISVDDNVTVLEKPAGERFTEEMMQRSSNSYLPLGNLGNSVTMKTADGRKLVAVTAKNSDLLVVYADVETAIPLAKVQVRGAHSLSVLELTAPGRNGQTLLAFIENEKLLRVVEYKGVEGFVDVTRVKLPFAVKEMVPVRLRARAFVNQRHFLLLRSDHQVLLLEVEMSGDPLDEPPLKCSLP